MKEQCPPPPPKKYFEFNIGLELSHIRVILITKKYDFIFKNTFQKVIKKFLLFFSTGPAVIHREKGEF